MNNKHFKWFKWSWAFYFTIDTFRAIFMETTIALMGSLIIFLFIPNIPSQFLNTVSFGFIAICVIRCIFNFVFQLVTEKQLNASIQEQFRRLGE